MRYAAEQLVRPRVEYGSDYGYGRRSVLVRNGLNELLHCTGHSYRSGMGCRDYFPAMIALWGPKAVHGRHGQRAIHEGRVAPADWEKLAPQIYTHLGMEFPIGLISLRHTLLLDEPGTVDGPPPRTRGPRKVYPRVAGGRLYKIIRNPETNDLLLIEFEVQQQSRGKVTFSRVGINRPREIKIVDLEREEYAMTPEGAAMLFRSYYVDRVEGIQDEIDRLQDQLSEASESLDRIDGQLEALRGQWLANSTASSTS